MLPTRIKRGGRFKPLPPGAKWCGRPSRWGNPWRVRDVWGTFVIDRDGKPVNAFVDEKDRAVAYSLALFARYARRRLAAEPRWLDPLRWCPYLACECGPDDPCHVDVLIDLIRRSA